MHTHTRRLKEILPNVLLFNKFIQESHTFVGLLRLAEPEGRGGAHTLNREGRRQLYLACHVTVLLLKVLGQLLQALVFAGEQRIQLGSGRP